MNGKSILFRCPTCDARIKAPVQLSGRNRDCPGCKHAFVVPRFIPDDAEPLFVLIEGEDRCLLGIAYRRTA